MKKAARRATHFGVDHGSFAKECGKHGAVPKKDNTGYFSVMSFERLPRDCRKVTLVATTKQLQRRWFQTPVGGIGGGRKWTITGWPVHVWGALNDDGEVCPVALAPTSTAQLEHVRPMVKEWERSARIVAGTSRKKEFGMCDDEDGYRATWTDLMGANGVLMCHFHMSRP